MSKETREQQDGTKKVELERSNSKRVFSLGAISSVVGAGLIAIGATGIAHNMKEDVRKELYEGPVMTERIEVINNSRNGFYVGSVLVGLVGLMVSANVASGVLARSDFRNKSKVSDFLIDEGYVLNDNNVISHGFLSDVALANLSSDGTVNLSLNGVRSLADINSKNIKFLGARLDLAEKLDDAGVRYSSVVEPGETADYLESSIDPVVAIVERLREL